jgi:Fe-S cluster assembly protein SufD
VSAVARILEEFGSRPAPRASQLAAAQALREHSLPNRRDENWRYANLRALEELPRFLPDSIAQEALDLPALPPALPGFERLVFLDGRLHAEASASALSKLTRLPHAAALGATPFETAGDGRFGLVARMFAPEPLALRMSGSMALETLFVLSAAATASYTELSIELDAGASLELIERNCGAAAARPGVDPHTLGCSTLQLKLGAGAQLTHTRVQQTAANALLYETIAACLAERSSYQFRHLTAGGASTRSSVQVQLQGAEASVDIRALAATRDAQYADALYTVLHEAPRTRSNLMFRGIASERSHVACSADFQVSPQAAGSRVLQSLRGLIDGKGAEVNLRPRLTINTDDIQAAHGAATGQLDENLLFYLLSRGLAPAAARSLLKWAFLGEMLGAVGPQALRKAAEAAVAGRLSDTPAAELLQ